MEPFSLGRNHGRISQRQSQLACFVAFVCAVHDETKRSILLAQTIEQLASFRGIMGLAWGKRERYGRSSIRGNHMNLGGPAAAVIRYFNNHSDTDLVS